MRFLQLLSAATLVPTLSFAAPADHDASLPYLSGLHQKRENLCNLTMPPALCQPNPSVTVEETASRAYKFYRAFVVDGDPRTMFSLIDSTYKQHHPGYTDGPEAIWPLFCSGPSFGTERNTTWCFDASSNMSYAQYSTTDRWLWVDGCVHEHNFVVATVRQPPVNFALPIGLNKTWVDLDLNATVAQAIETIQQAKDEGVALLAFPELYFPGYPIAINTAYTPSQIAQYVSQSMSLDSPQFLSLLEAFKDAGIYGTLEFSELAEDKIFMGQILIGPDGTVLHHRRKLRPFGTERYIWSDGDISGLEVTATPHSRIGMLECWERFHPTMTFAMQAQMENIHIAAFPYAPDFGTDPQAWESAEVGIASARVYATSSGACVIMPFVGTAAIFAAGVGNLKVINATESPHLRYITASLNTSTFSNATYDTGGEQSWAALQQMIAEFPSYLPRASGTHFDHEDHNVESITS
ncbi:putative Carbon-nitrogen hydrolase [Seiridium unicorne]|uniref:Carbon-nitrogen hydrolase n=1 Tax=Seiridium unicorne TaxID=138068 RepID=A0ABR2UGT4_9PEZI